MEGQAGAWPRPGSKTAAGGLLQQPTAAHDAGAGWASAAGKRPLKCIRLQLIKALESARGNGTSMISLILPPKDQVRVVKAGAGEGVRVARLLL